MKKDESSISLGTLPSEILVHILEATDTTSLACLCQCSRLFFRVAQPVLYRHIAFHRPSIKEYDRIFFERAEPELHRLRETTIHLQRHPALAQLCQSLTILPPCPQIPTGQLTFSNDLGYRSFVRPPLEQELEKAIEILSLPSERSVWKSLAQRRDIEGEDAVLAVLILSLPRLESIEMNYDSDTLPFLSKIVARIMVGHLSDPTDVAAGKTLLGHLRQVRLIGRADGRTALADAEVAVSWFGLVCVKSITLSMFTSLRFSPDWADIWEDSEEEGDDLERRNPLGSDIEADNEIDDHPVVEDYDQYQESDDNGIVQKPTIGSADSSWLRAVNFKSAPYRWSNVEEINLISCRFNADLLDGMLRAPRALKRFNLLISRDALGRTPFSVKRLRKSLNHQRASLEYLCLDRSDDLIDEEHYGKFIWDDDSHSDSDAMASLSKFNNLKILDVATMFVNGIRIENRISALRPWDLLPGASDWDPSKQNEAECEWLARWLPRPNLETLILRNCDDSVDESYFLSFVEMLLRILKQHRTGTGSWFKHSYWRESTKNDFARLRRIELHGRSWCSQEYDYPKLIQRASEVPDLEVAITGVFANTN